jgi:hypothetical protein
MKAQVLKIVKGALAGAEDNLYRAEMEFKNRTAKGMLEEHGQSGRTCADILGGYQDQKAELERCVKWVETA